MSITAGIAVMLLLILGTGATSILSTTYTLSATLGEPFFVEKWKSTIQKEIGINRTQYNFTAYGTNDEWQPRSNRQRRVCKCL